MRIPTRPPPPIAGGGGLISLFRVVRIPLSLCVADGAEGVGGARISRSLGVADSGEACEGFGCGGAAADALTHAGGGELRRAWKLVDFAV